MSLAGRDQLARTFYDVVVSSPDGDLFQKMQRLATIALVVEHEAVREVKRELLAVARRKEQAAGVLSKALARAVWRLEQNGFGPEVDEILATVAPTEVSYR